MTVFSKATRILAFGVLMGGLGYSVTVPDVVAQSAGRGNVSSANEQRGIAAIVNDDIITTRDLEMRSKLALLSSRIPDTPDNRRRVQPLVIRKLIEEHLQWQEAKRRGISVSDGEIAQGVAIIERRGGMAPGSLSSTLQRSGVDIRTIRDQIRSDIAWVKLLHQQVSPRIRISEAEIDRRFDTVVGSNDRVEYQLSEIFIAADDSKDIAAARRDVQQLLNQLRQGTPFPAVAQQFSQSVSASNGGDLGWVREEALRPELKAAAQKLRPGQISEPIQVENGIYLLAVRDRRGGKEEAFPEPPAPQIRRRALPADPEKVTVTLAQLVFPFPPDASEADQKAMQERAAKARSSIKSCSDIDRIAQEQGLPQSGSIGSMKASDLSPPVRSIIMPIQAGRTTAPLNRGDAAVILMVCERQDPPTRYVEETIAPPPVPEPPPPPTREMVKERLQDEKLDMESRRLLRDLRRSAYLDIRI